MKITLNIEFKPEAIVKIREEAEELGGIELAKKQLADSLLDIGDEGTPEEVESITIKIEAPELEKEQQ